MSWALLDRRSFMVRRRSTVRFRKGAPRSEGFFEYHLMTSLGAGECEDKVTLRSACRLAGQRVPRRSISVVEGTSGGQSQATIDREALRSVQRGLAARSCPWALSEVPGLSLRRVGWVVLAPGFGLEGGSVRVARRGAGSAGGAVVAEPALEGCRLGWGICA
jgi:hypothetical protein